MLSLARVFPLALGLGLCLTPASSQVMESSIQLPGGSAERLLSVEPGRSITLELIFPAQQKTPADHVHYSLWAVGGNLLAPLAKDQPVEIEEIARDEFSVRSRFTLPVLPGKIGAKFRLDLKADQRELAHSWLELTSPFEPEPFRIWADSHHLFIDPSLKNIVEAFNAWKIPLDPGDSAEIAVIGKDGSSPDGVKSTLELRSTHGDFLRLVVRDSHHVEADLPGTDHLLLNPAERREFFAALQEAAKPISTDFPSP